MVREALLAEAERGGFFSYAAGVAYQILTHYRVRGLEVDNYLTDLPVKKGLSSSAAFCVLIARAFNRIYDLKMTVRGEMEFAYSGEITTPSRCGRMDQGCAYGGRPILMTFDGDRIDIEELKVPRNLYFVIADLGAGKDTKEILSKLNRCYPFAENELQRGRAEVPRRGQRGDHPRSLPGAGERRCRADRRIDAQGAGGVRPASPAGVPLRTDGAGAAQGPELPADPAARSRRQGRRLAGRRLRAVHRQGRGEPAESRGDPRAGTAPVLPEARAGVRPEGPKGRHSGRRLRHAPVPRVEGRQEGTVPGH